MDCCAAGLAHLGQISRPKITRKNLSKFPRYPTLACRRRTSPGLSPISPRQTPLDQNELLQRLLFHQAQREHQLLRMESVFIREKLAPAILDASHTKSQDCLALIRLMIDDGPLSQIKHHTSAKAAWDALKTLFTRRRHTQWSHHTYIRSSQRGKSSSNSGTRRRTTRANPTTSLTIRSASSRTSATPLRLGPATFTYYQAEPKHTISSTWNGIRPFAKHTTSSRVTLTPFYSSDVSVRGQFVISREEVNHQHYYTDWTTTSFKKLRVKHPTKTNTTQLRDPFCLH